ncbi:protein GPR107 isoform X1 [Neodiprion pinetum]|uniref:Protein GPR107 isoform X1 n=1 Tax=Neodiprion lecontei TaxID=441921 RepID=A0A6J0BID9_NEOLC|nr:protein GPR107 isoform X1 [Neodiprion lecontei]XP_046468419.1 protein GPR107 isoform X1 [Neodiprion pinetum]
MYSKSVIVSCIVVLTLASLTQARIHKLEIRNDVRAYIALSTFGFYEGGTLRVNLTNFKVEQGAEDAVFGFSLERTLSDVSNSYTENQREKCPLLDETAQLNEAVYFKMDLRHSIMNVTCKKDLNLISIHPSEDVVQVRLKRNAERLQDTASSPRIDHAMSDFGKRSVQSYNPPSIKSGCPRSEIPIHFKNATSTGLSKVKYYSTSFYVNVMNQSNEGLYNLYFHNCRNYDDKTNMPVDFTLQIKEDNHGNFLSAGEMPLPALYFMMALLFFLSGCFWVFILKRSKHPVFKIHYLMAVLVYLKSLSLLFHGINFHFIETKGEHVAAWAILYYITHLLKGAVLFITIVLVGTGWDFIKHILSDKDKKLFMIVIPLQVLANVAEIIIEESEEGDIEHQKWRDVFILVDLLCCGAILFPVVWSIRHLQEAARTDGKAAINLRKLKLFRHFYIMIVCYIYFTRIIVYLLRITVPFQYEWLDEMFREMATYVFFVLTGYKFRPASANPYFTIANEDLPGDDNDDEMDVVLFSSISGRSGATEGLNKINKGTTLAKSTPCNVVGTREEMDNLLSKRESSHEYD